MDGLAVGDMSPAQRQLAYDVYWDQLLKRAPEPTKELKALSDALR